MSSQLFCNIWLIAFEQFFQMFILKIYNRSHVLVDFSFAVPGYWHMWVSTTCSSYPCSPSLVRTGLKYWISFTAIEPSVQNHWLLWEQFFGSYNFNTFASAESFGSMLNKVFGCSELRSIKIIPLAFELFQFKNLGRLRVSKKNIKNCT